MRSFIRGKGFTSIRLQLVGVFPLREGDDGEGRNVSSDFMTVS